MAEAISALRVGSQALRQENRELRLALQATQRSSPITGRSHLRARDRQLEPGVPPFETELRGRAEIARREQQALRHRTGS